MKILFIVHGFPPDALGGTEIYTHDLAHAFVRRGAEVTILCREADPARPEYAVRREEREGLIVWRINNTFRDVRAYQDVYRNAAIRDLAAALVDEIRPDIVHLQHITCLSTDLLIEFGRRGLPVFFTLNDYWLLCQRGQLLDLDGERCPGPTHGCSRCADAAAGAPPSVHRAAAIWRRIERFLPSAPAAPLGRFARRCAEAWSDGETASREMARRNEHIRAMAAHVTFFLTPSQTLHDRFLDFGIPAEKLRRIEQGIAQERLLQVAGERRRAEGEPLRVGFLGSLIVSKAPHVLLEAFAGLPEGAATLEIYGAIAPYHGDDSYRARLESLLEGDAARRRGIRFHGPVPHAEVPRALASIDVMVLPSIWLENAPFSIREAFTAGVPVAASRLGGMAEMVEDGVTGLLFEPGDAQDLCRVLRRLVDEPELLPRLRAALPRQRTLDEVAEELDGLYRDTLTSPRSAAPHGRLAAVVLNYRTPRDTLLAVRSLASSRRRVDRILVVDNGSAIDDPADRSLEILRAELGGIDRVEILETGANLGFSGGVNVGIRRALEDGAARVFLLNSDAMVDRDCLGRLEAALDGESDVGIAGPTVLAAQDPSIVASTGIGFARWTGRMRHRGAGAAHDPNAAPEIVEVPAVAGCAMLIDRAVVDAIGLFDEDYFFSYEDLDYCLRARGAGLRSVTATDAVAYHQGCRSIGPTSPQRLYYGARNHLLAARRAAPLPWPWSWGRAKLIVALNLAFALRGSGAPRGEAVRAVLRGVRDHLRGRYGA